MLLLVFVLASVGFVVGVILAAGVLLCRWCYYVVVGVGVVGVVVGVIVVVGVVRLVFLLCCHVVGVVVVV